MARWARAPSAAGSVRARGARKECAIVAGRWGRVVTVPRMIGAAMDRGAWGPMTINRAGRGVRNGCVIVAGRWGRVVTVPRMIGAATARGAWVLVMSGRTGRAIR